MEPNKQGECKSSSTEETDQSDNSSNEEMGGHGRSYECVFCKRGFTTAQALGGHMNIHRKDRAKPKASSGSTSSALSSKLDDGYGSFRGYPPTQNDPSYNPMHHEVHANYQAFYPTSSTWGYRPPHEQGYGDDFYGRNSHHYGSQYGEDWRRNGLSRQIDIGSSIDDENRSRRREADEDELDLELRLGHHHDRYR